MKRLFLLWILAAALPALSVRAQDNETCLMCHEDETLTGLDAGGNEISVYVAPDALEHSVHAGMECINCHIDLDGFEDWPHPEQLEPVDCSMCHDVADALAGSVHSAAETGGRAVQCYQCHGNHNIQPPQESDPADGGVHCGACHTKIEKEYEQSLHGQAVHSGEKLAPRCWDCHGGHDILPPSNPESKVTKFNIPFMCGSCHKEGSPVDQRYQIPADSILSHYTESIHGAGLYKQGLTVAAVCSDCHTAHNVRPHTDPKSSIYRTNVAATCQQCHGRIEQVHQKVIRGELWEKEPGKVPVCVDCHSPHEIRRVFYEEGMSNAECLKCHSNPSLSMQRFGETVSLYVDSIETHNSIHRSVTCAQCHTGVTPRHDVRPCATVKDKVDCSICHAEIVQVYDGSMHGQLSQRGDPDAPQCVDCHGTHGILNKLNSSSPTYPRNVPMLCARCHQKGATAAQRIGEAEDRVEEYEESIHGKGLLESGLVVTAMCTDCHTAHNVRPQTDPKSTVNRANIPETCAKCHNGIYEKFEKSIHSPLVAETDKKLPICNDCHHSHTITRADRADFRLTVRKQCGECHEDVTESYFETVHGKVSDLGGTAAAQCYDCHGSHDILPPDDPNSHLSHQNIVATCGQCHSGSHRQFAGYLTHATHHDRTKYPILFYAFWFMTILLVGTLIVAGTHTLLWLPRSWQMMKEHKKIRIHARGNLEYRRFKPLHSRLHIMVVTSFLALAITGMTLKFSYLGWAQWISSLLGGFESTGYIHRLGAIVTFCYFGIHLYDLIRDKVHQRKSWREMLFDKNSMLPNMNDLREAIGTVKWFLGRGERPKYGRWTYWEKFDYFAVFWGVFIIGSTGLILWFPEFFTLVLPGWVINVASIVHSDEALLAVAFIFTVHFFNTHFRPDKFPMDTVIFTGRVPLEELKEDRPREYEELIKSRGFKKRLAEPLPPVMVRTAKIFGTIALIIGLSLILLIIYAEIFGYR